MKKSMRKLNRYFKSAANRRNAFKAKGPLERLSDLEVRHDLLGQEVSVLRAELQMASMRQQALVDYYESRIDLIYSRLSADLSGQQGVPIHIEQDADVDTRLVGELRRVLQVREGYFDIPVASILSDHLEAGQVRAPLTLQGFRINRALASEAGNKIVVAGVVEGAGKTALYGPYKQLVAGKYRITLRCAVGVEGQKPDVRFDVFCPTLDRVVAENKAPASVNSKGQFALGVDVDWGAEDSAHELEFRVHQRGSAGFEIIGFDIDPVARDAASE